LKKDGNVLSVGSNSNGELGINKISDTPFSNFQEITYFPNHNLPIKHIYAGDGISIGICVGYNFWVWGNNYSNQLGMRTNKAFLEPIENEYFLGKRISQVSSGFAHTSNFKLILVVLSSATFEIFGFGNNRLGQLSLGNFVTYTEIKKINMDRVSTVSTGSETSYIITMDGKVYSTGNNEMGQLGY
jgi:alpha-tubulin suppressor-like RCC1 family protein